MKTVFSTLLGINTIQNELNKPDLALGTSEASLWLGWGDMHVNRYDAIHAKTGMLRALRMQSTSFNSLQTSLKSRKNYIQGSGNIICKGQEKL